jgi:Tfp pilus assembly pilus retraction ATPase PilT
MTKNKGSITQEESLQHLVRQGALDREDATLYAAHPDDFLSLVRAEGRQAG